MVYMEMLQLSWNLQAIRQFTTTAKYAEAEGVVPWAMQVRIEWLSINVPEA